jgi:RNA polymerase sigma-70 factor (ECF subfamily)
MAADSPGASAPVADEDLVESILEGDEKAFDALYERYFPRVYGFVERRLNSRTDAEEVTREAFVNLFLSLPGFGREVPFAAWVLGVTRRTIGARLEKKRCEAVALGEEGAERPATGFATASCADAITE